MTPLEAAALIERWPDLADTSLACRQHYAYDIVRAFRKALVDAAPPDRIARYYPLQGVTEAFFRQGVYPAGLWHDRVRQRLLRWLNCHIMQFMGDRPGVTDFYIAQWLILRDPALADKLYRRQIHPDPAIAMSCSWALESLVQRFPDLVQQLQQAHAAWLRER